VGQAGTATAVRVQGLWKAFGPRVAVAGIDLGLPAGRFIGLVGPNGAGKTTTLSMVTGLLRPDQGSVEVVGHDVWRDPAQVKARIGVLPEGLRLFERLSGRELLGYTGRLRGLPGAEVDKRATQLLDVLDLAGDQHKLVVDYSTGMRKKIGLAAALLHNPEVLFLDEPTLGLDPQTRKRIWDYLSALRKREDVTLFMTTHYMDEAEFCDRIAIIDRGTIVALGTPAELKGRIGGDVITLAVADVPAAAREIQERFGIAPLAANGTLRIEVPDGAAFLPRLVRELPVLISTVSLSRPSLDDVFLKLTGHAIRSEGASDKDMLRNMSRMWRGGRR
jgi:ABC-2 type transport system ATP-binding protein